MPEEVVHSYVAYITNRCKKRAYKTKKVRALRFPKMDLVSTRTPLSTGFRFWYARVASCGIADREAVSEMDIRKPDCQEYYDR